MPTINQLPAATQVTSSDQLPISQAGATKSTSIAVLLAADQPAITTATNTLLGRASLGAGGPEPIAIGPGLALAAAGLTCTGTDHAGFPSASSFTATDEVVLNSGGQTPPTARAAASHPVHTRRQRQHRSETA